MATLLSSVSPSLLPPEIVRPIFDKTNEISAVQALAQRVPLPLTAETDIPVSLDIPVAGWVDEGAAKAVGNGGVGLKRMKGKKLALLLPVSQEVAYTNAAGLYDSLVAKLPLALSRAFDYACIHGGDLRTGGAGPFPSYLTQGAATIELGTTAQNAGGMYVDLVQGEKLVTDAGYDFTGFAADPRLKPTLKLQSDTIGHPLWVDAGDGLGAPNASVIGYPATYNRGVSGSYRYSGNRVQVVTITGTPTGGTFVLTLAGVSTAPLAYNAAASVVQAAIRALAAPWAGATVTGSAGGPYTVTLSPLGGASAPILADGSALTGGTTPAAVVAQTPTPDTKLRAIGGDWSQCAWGQGMDITIKVSDEASYVDENGTTVSAFQNNLVLLLIEAHYGFVKSDALGAFVAYTDAA